MRKLAHIINPFMAGPSSDLFAAQPVTFETMRMARDLAAGRVAVELLSAQYPEDHPVIPPFLRKTPDLTKSVLDYGEFQKPRRLPLLRDILDRLYEGSDAEYLIYTNVDIALQPYFYLAVDRIIEEGFDAFVINRRTISKDHENLEHIPLMFAQVGKPHLGWDCFIFSRTAYAKYKLGSFCIGVSRADLGLLANMTAFARSFHEFRHLHLTFHLGDDRSWFNKAYADYQDHNTTELLKTLNALESETGAFGRETIPGSFLFKKRRFGFLYEALVRRMYLPSGLVQLLNRIIGRL